MQKQCKSPSTEAKPSNLIKTQKKGRVQAIYNGRPPSLQGPHIHPYHTVFSHFQQKLQRPLSTVDFLEKELLRASYIISDSAAFYGDEEKRQHTLQHWIEAFLGSGALSATAYFSGSQKYRPSGSLRTVCGLYEERRGERDMLKLITEVKNEIGTGNCCPTEQAEKDYQLTCIQPEVCRISNLYRLNIQPTRLARRSASQFMHARFHPCHRWPAHFRLWCHIPRRSGITAPDSSHSSCSELF